MKKESIIKVFYFKTGKDQKIGNMENTVDGIRKAIGGGYFQVINLENNMVVLCDDEGLIKELPYNRGLRGDWIIVGTEGEEFVSLTDQKVEWIKKNIKYIIARLAGLS